MKINQIAEKNDKELDQLIVTTRNELAEAAVEARTKQLPNVKRIWQIKRQLARALTIQRQRQITEMEKDNG